jgi:hypothetical protein
MFGEYAALAKWLAIIAAVTTLIYTPYHIGRTLERNAWVLIEKDKQILADKTLMELNNKAMKQQEESTLLAQQLEMQANDHQNEINQLNSDLVNVKRVQSKSLCTDRRTVTTSKDSHTGKIIETASNTATLSDEFTKFIISDAMRADSVGIWADEAYSLIINLCKDKERFICEK